MVPFLHTETFKLSNKKRVFSIPHNKLSSIFKFTTENGRDSYAKKGYFSKCKSKEAEELIDNYCSFFLKQLPAHSFNGRFLHTYTFKLSNKKSFFSTYFAQ